MRKKDVVKISLVSFYTKKKKKKQKKKKNTKKQMFPKPKVKLWSNSKTETGGRK